jgi:hypothetical protein
MAQALFAQGNYDAAAGAVQSALSSLPQEKWNVVLANRSELYPSPSTYTDQLNQLTAAAGKTDSPAMQFLLGYHRVRLPRVEVDGAGANQLRARHRVGRPCTP